MCKKLGQYLLFILLFVHHFAYATLNSAELKEKIDDILDKGASVSHVGVIVQSMDTGKVLYQKNSEQLFMPASVQKILTAVAALVYLGPDYQYGTQLLTEGKIQNNTLGGNLIVKFSGDPTLTQADIDGLVKQLKEKNVNTIRGSIDIDNSDYNNTPYGPGWVYDDLSYAYAAPTNAIVIDNNSFVVDFIPGEILGQPATLHIKLPNTLIKFDNHLRTTSGKQSCPIAIYSNWHNEYEVNGCLEKRYGIQHRELAIREPEQYATYILQKTLAQNNIQYTGPIRIFHTDNPTSVLATHSSKSLHFLIKTMLKDSDNLIADSLLKRIGAYYFHAPGAWKNGSKAIQQILTKEAGITFQKNTIVDGAGLSRYNFLTPSQLSQVLYYSYRNQKIVDHFFEALPIAGKDGTLAYRMKSFLNPQIDIRGKTGTMAGISTLSGYITTADHRRLSYVIMVNDYTGKHRPYRHVEDQICELLAES